MMYRIVALDRDMYRILRKCIVAALEYSERSGREKRTSTVIEHRLRIVPLPLVFVHKGRLEKIESLIVRASKERTFPYYSEVLTFVLSCD